MDYDYGLSDGEHYEMYGDRCATIPEAIRELAEARGLEIARGRRPLTV